MDPGKGIDIHEGLEVKDRRGYEELNKASTSLAFIFKV